MAKKIRLIPSLVDFSVEEGETILDAALRQNIPLSHSCKTGRCSSCQAEAVENGVEKKVLTCQYTPKDDVTLYADYYPQLVAIEEKLIPCKVSDFTLIANQVLVFRLRIPPQQLLTYLPGQYLDLSLNGISRSYSIASHPDDPYIELHVKKVETGVMSEQLFTQMRQNLLMRLHGPKGTFFIRELDSDRPIIFLATGTGFAPIKAMLKQLFKIGYKGDIYLFWGNRYLTDFYDEKADDWQKNHSNFHYTPVVSREVGTTTVIKGYVQHTAVQKLNDFSHSHVYACGSPAMIESAKDLLVQHGLDAKYFYSDAFVASTN